MRNLHCKKLTVVLTRFSYLSCMTPLVIPHYCSRKVVIKMLHAECGESSGLHMFNDG